MALYRPPLRNSPQNLISLHRIRCRKNAVRASSHEHGHGHFRKRCPAQYSIRSSHTNHPYSLDATHGPPGRIYDPPFSALLRCSHEDRHPSSVSQLSIHTVPDPTRLAPMDATRPLIDSVRHPETPMDGPSAFHSPRP